MKLQIEFTGVARLIAGENAITLDVPTETRYRDIVRLLGEKYPALVGIFINESGDTLLSSILLSRNGEEMIMPEQNDESPLGGDRLILMSVITGG